ncbi:mas-related G-protein coupled receptor member X4-like [Erinaceus europaeus]|uniref:Mas-related G-protein coupled receptor member X4-like n=1 Tax=Erinaceus europaeus TaxID=9365 RepID=A0ABM3WW62_ERIEU|nr:mas-related G-protein coupled receptor member X4-like [Erinaceus europaeus]XP_060040792.1 mas-related G-protein coupled receptor member X4-like [Erinaceus europaeus]
MEPEHRNYTVGLLPPNSNNEFLEMEDKSYFIVTGLWPSEQMSGDGPLIAENISTVVTPSGDRSRVSFDFRNIVFLLTVLLGLCGSVGNGVVIWLLGFCVKRNPFSVYILNLACADFTFLLCNSIWLILILSQIYEDVNTELLEAVKLTSFLVGLSLLMAVSTERCVSVLWPLWYRCRRPQRLSSILCALIWALALFSGAFQLLCEYMVGFSCDVFYLVLDGVSFITFLVLCVSCLTLLIRVQCGSRRSPPTRLYVTILLSVLVFLLLGLPLGAGLMAYRLSSAVSHSDTVLPVLYLLSAMNSVVNPIIYFFVGRHRQPQPRKSLREALQRALTDDTELSGKKGVTVPGQNAMATCPSGSEGEGCLLEFKSDPGNKDSHPATKLQMLP